MLTKRTEYKGQGTSWWKSPPVCLSYLQLWHLKHLTQRHWRSKLYVFRPTGALIHLCPWHGGWIRADLSYWPSLCLSLSSAKYIAGQQLCIFRPDPFGVSELQVSWGTPSQGQLRWPTIYIQNMHFVVLPKMHVKISDFGEWKIGFILDFNFHHLLTWALCHEKMLDEEEKISCVYFFNQGH